MVFFLFKKDSFAMEQSNFSINALKTTKYAKMPLDNKNNTLSQYVHNFTGNIQSSSCM